MASTGEPFGLFWNSNSGDRTYDASSFEYWLKKFFTSGVFKDDLQVLATSGMNVSVGTGYANVDGKVKFWFEETDLTISPAHSTYDRIDTIVITRDNTARSIDIEVVTGSYSGVAPQPTAPVRNAEKYQLVLAQIYIKHGDTAVTQGVITDTRPDPNLCGYITGTVTEMDFSQFSAQFASYYNEFVSTSESEYDAWFAGMMAQALEDKTEWDEWYAQLVEDLHDLPEDTAEYLQAEIDELKVMGGGGSIITISTSYPSFVGAGVTVTSEDGTEVLTGTFDSTLNVIFKGFKSTGATTITATDGTDTLTSTLGIPYYGNYKVQLSAWNATVNIHGDENLYGATVGVRDSNNVLVGTVVLSSVDGSGTFTAIKADTYTFSVLYEGEIISASLAVLQQTTYSVSLSTGFNWKEWVNASRTLDPSDYDDLDELLADEEALRQLFLVHDCVDYMAQSEAVNEALETIIENDLCAKWINLCDYALDNLYANTAIKAAMDTADKYGYGEWVITDNTTTPPTWGPKGNVPVMTSDTAPYGTVSAVSQASGKLRYYAFDNDTSTAWGDNGVTSGNNAYIQYKFTNPVCAKRVYLYVDSGSYQRVSDVQIVGSNDGVTFSEALNSDTAPHADGYTYELNNNAYYLYYRVIGKKTTSSSWNVSTLQFYGRELKVSVPTMTSNTAPYGEVITDPSYTYSSSSKPYMAFDKNNSNAASVNPARTEASIGYAFTSPVIIKKAFVYTSAAVTSYQIQYSDDKSTWVNASAVETNLNGLIDIFDTIGTHRYWRCVRNSSGAIQTIIHELNFYGLDYSEKEFEVGTTKKWLYDHGVEVETLIPYTVGTNTDAQTDYNDSLMLSLPASTQRSASITSQQDLTSYSLLRGVCGDELVKQIGLSVFDTSSVTYTTESVAKNNIEPANGNLPNNMSLDISTVTGNYYVGIFESQNTGSNLQKATCKELWLE